MWHLQTTQNLEFHLYVGAPSSQIQLNNGQLINGMYHAAVIMTLSSTAGYKCFLLLLLISKSYFFRNYNHTIKLRLTANICLVEYIPFILFLPILMLSNCHFGFVTFLLLPNVFVSRIIVICYKKCLPYTY